VAVGNDPFDAHAFAGCEPIVTLFDTVFVDSSEEILDRCSKHVSICAWRRSFYGLRRFRVHGRFLAPPVDPILELPAGGIEGVANRHVDVLVRVVSFRVTADDQLRTGKRHQNAHVIDGALVMAPVLRFDAYSAARNSVGEVLELFRLAGDSGLDRGRLLKAAKRDLQRNVHLLAPVLTILKV
jgi:hypothetical protein